MLIKCPECNHDVSDRANLCPNCGFPIHGVEIPTQQVKKRSRGKFRRLPNGFGSIKQLSGKRRNPYAAYPPVKEFTLEGKPKQPKAIGYFPTYNEAYTALAEYNKEPYNLGSSEMTFADLYGAFTDYKSSLVGKSSMRSYKTAYRYFEPLADKPFRLLKTQDYQNVFEGIPYGYATSDNCKKLLTAMYRYAIQNDIVSTNYGEYIVVGKENDIQKGVPFTEDELRRLWKFKDDPDGKIINIMIYTGLRIGEIQGYNYADGIIIGGIKTEAGRNRKIPVLEELKPLVESFDNFSFMPRTARNNNHFPRVFKEAECLFAANGQRHTSHDCRHTFSWLADKYKLDDMAKHMIMGHSLGKDVEKNVYGHRTLEELTEEMNKIQIIK